MFRNHFAGKKITLMGLGLLGRGLGDAKFLVAAGADLIVTDLKTEAELAPSVAALAEVRDSLGGAAQGRPANIVFHLGGHRLEDFENRDLIIKAPNTPLDSPFIAHARDRGIPIEMDAALFVKLCAAEFPATPGAQSVAAPTIVGITGTRGKSTVTQLIYEMARAAFGDGSMGAAGGGHRAVYLGGNVRDTATLPLIEKIEIDQAAGTRDLIILELDSWQLQGFEADVISPHIAVWTNFMPDHMNYYHGDMERYFADKAAIARFQNASDVFIAPREIKERVETTFFTGGKLPAQYIDPSSAPNLVPADWEIALPGEHNRANAACAVAAARALNITDDIIKKILKDFRGLPNRLEFFGERAGIAFYNDSNATTPDATIAALKTLRDTGATKGRPIILIAGGTDKELDFTELAQELADLRIKKLLKAVVLFEGKASEKLKALLSKSLPVMMAADMPAAFAAALAAAASSDVILLSPAATSFGIFKNEYDRGEQFAKEFQQLD